MFGGGDEENRRIQTCSVEIRIYGSTGYRQGEAGELRAERVG